MTHAMREMTELIPFRRGIKQNQIVHNFLELIETHYKEGLKAEKYAQKLFISNSKLDRCCKAIYQKTATELISRRVIEEAKKMLATTDAPIKEIAWNLGKSYESNFIAFFIKETGMSPTMYRLNVISQQDTPLS